MSGIWRLWTKYIVRIFSQSLPYTFYYILPPENTMSEYNELIKHFDRIRSYVRDFYIYGFKTREDFREKSGRTYDNQRRRMESWFSDYIRQDRSGHKKQVFLTLDSGRMAVNPLYQAWKSKTFTDNDIALRSFLPDLLGDG